MGSLGFKACATIFIMKALFWIGITVGGTGGGWIGAAMDHGNWMGGWSILLSAVGSLLGLWAAYKLYKNY